MKKVAFWLACLVALSLVLTACTGGGGGDVVRVGVIAELTGDIPAVGASCKNAAEMAVQEINAAGGLDIGGKKYKIELYIEDNAGKADQSAAAAQKLITQQNVAAIIGPNASRYAIPAAEVAESSKVVLISPWSTNPKTTVVEKTGESKKYVFRAAFIDPFQGRVVAKFALDSLKATKAAVLYDVASDYNKGIAEFFKQTFEENGGTVVAFETYTTNDKDFSAQLTKIKSAEPDVIFLPNYYSEVPLQIQQAHRLNITVPFLGKGLSGLANRPLGMGVGVTCVVGIVFLTLTGFDGPGPTARSSRSPTRSSPPARPAACSSTPTGSAPTATRSRGGAATAPAPTWPTSRPSGATWTTWSATSRTPRP